MSVIHVQKPNLIRVTRGAADKTWLQVLDIKPVATCIQANSILLIKYARPEDARRTRARGCRWRELGEGPILISPTNWHTHQLLGRRSKERIPEVRQWPQQRLKRSCTLCDRIPRNAGRAVLESQNPTGCGVSGLEHENARSASSVGSLSSRHNDSCNREYDASRTRRRCATASSVASNIEKTRPQEHSGVS